MELGEESRTKDAEGTEGTEEFLGRLRIVLDDDDQGGSGITLNSFEYSSHKNSLNPP
jgi:hypothetical protein